MMDSNRVWFITGASSGLGHELAKAVIGLGDRVVVAARRVDRLEALVAEAQDRVLAVALDLTDATSRENAIGEALEKFGRIDVLANIAGRGINGAAEELAIEQIRGAFELNFFGAIELTRLVLPQMRVRKSGHIINVTSICGLVPVADLGVYCATKFALEAWSEALADEVRHLGIRMTIVEPGGFRTEFEGAAIVRPITRIADYASVVGPIEEGLMANAGKQRGNPAVAAMIMIEAVADFSSPLRLVLGGDAHEMWDGYAKRNAQTIGQWKKRGVSTDYADAAPTIL